MGDEIFKKFNIKGGEKKKLGMIGRKKALYQTEFIINKKKGTMTQSEIIDLKKYFESLMKKKELNVRGGVVRVATSAGRFFSFRFVDLEPNFLEEYYTGHDQVKDLSQYINKSQACIFVVKYF